MDLPLCECGCGERVRLPKHRFVYAHNFRGKKLTAEHRRKIGEANKRRKFSAETKRKIGEAHKGKRLSLEHRRNISKGGRGKKRSLKQRRNYSKGRLAFLASAAGQLWLDRYVNGQHCPFCAIDQSGDNNPMFGKKHSKETRRKISEATKGEKSNRWLGGISFEPYGLEFNDALRVAIRERDGFTCTLCTISENGKAHHCHHIDYDKTNNEPGNFCLLCHRCHSKTNINRAFWTNLFQAQVKMGLT